jgi:hypothetical protein
MISSPQQDQVWLRVMLYGEFGVGKTFLAAGADDVESMRDVFYIDAESGKLSLSNRPNMSLVRINSYRQIRYIYEFLRRHCQLRDDGDEEGLADLAAQYSRGGVPDKPKVYRTVVIDSLTEVYRYLMYQVTGVRQGNHPLDQEPPAKQWQDWGKAGEMMLFLVRSFRDLPMHVIFVASAATFEDDAKRQLKSPDFPGRLRWQLQGFVDVVGYMVSAAGEEGAIQRRLYLTPGRNYQAKHRFVGFKGAYVDNPSMSTLMDLASGQK